MKRILILILPLLFLSKTLFSQVQVQPITLQQVIELSNENSTTLKAIELQNKLTLADEDMARSWWLPEIYGGLALHQLWGSAMNGDGRFFTDVNRHNSWTGLGAKANWDFAKGMSDLKAARLNNRHQFEMSKSERNKEILRSIEKYYDLLSSFLELRLLDQLLVSNDTICAQIGTRVAAGISYQSEESICKAQLLQLKLQRSKVLREYLRLETDLKIEMNLAADLRLVPADSLLIPIQILEKGWEESDIEDVQGKRHDLLALNHKIDLLEVYANNQAKGFLIPQLNLATYTSAFGDVFSPLNPTSAINASLMWRFPLGEIFYQGNKKRYLAQRDMEDNKVNALKLTMNAGMEQYKLEQRLLEDHIATATESKEAGKKALAEVLQRQKQGLSIPFELIQAQEVYTSSRMSYYQSIIDYNKQQFRVFVELGNDI